MMKLKDVYSVSLCKNGILGGLLYVKDEEMVYCTNKRTVPENIRRAHMPYREILKISEAPWHTVKISMKNGETYRFLMFSRKSLLQKTSTRI